MVAAPVGNPRNSHLTGDGLASTMNTVAHVLHAMRLWVHQRPVTYVVWAGTALAILLVVLVAAPRAVRRLCRVGDRAVKPVSFFSFLALAGLAVLGWLDSGQRLPVATTAAARTQTEFTQSVTASSEPFSLFAFNSFQLALSRDSSVLGMVPELVLPQRWTDLAISRSFQASIVGIPSDLSTVIYPERTVSRALKGEIARWQRRLRLLKPGHVYVDGSTARAYGIRPKDILAIRRSGPASFWTVQRTIPRGMFTRTGGIVMRLSDAQTFAGKFQRVSRAAIFITAPDLRYPVPVRHRLRRAAAVLPPHAISAPRAIVHWARAVTKLTADWTRRVAALAVFAVFVGSLALLVLGRRARRQTAAAGGGVRIE